MKTSTILVIVGIAIMTGSFFALVIGVDMVRTGPAEPNEPRSGWGSDIGCVELKEVKE